MGLEVGVTKIADLDSTWPTSTDERSNGDDHLRNIKVALRSLLTDVNQIRIGPASLTGQAGKVLKVNAGETAYELGTLVAVLAPLLIGQPVRDSTYEGTITGSGTAFALSQTPLTTVSLILFRNGKQMTRGAGQDFTISGANITLALALEADEALEAHYTV